MMANKSDQAKIYLAMVKKHHFWALCLIVVLVAGYGWRSATASLEEQALANQSTIEGKFGVLNGITVFRNDSFKTGVEELHDQVKERVGDLWNEMYDRQKSEFKWPDAVKSIASLPPKAEIPPSVRTDYNDNVINSEWRRLFKWVKVREEVEEEVIVPNQSGAAAQQRLKKVTGIVDWPETDRDRLPNRYHRPTQPSTMDVRIAQEDLWIFEALLTIIRNMNKDATDTLNAPIKKIEFLDIAQYAVSKGISAHQTGWETDDEARKWADRVLGAVEAPVATPVTTTSTSSFTTRDASLLNGRYLNKEGEPVLLPQEANGYAALIDAYEQVQPFAEFKQVFVHMELVMDQREINDLLVKCANSPLMVEVRRVTFASSGNTNTAGPLKIGGPTSSNVPEQPYDVHVAVSGVMYLYNPPNDESLGQGTATDPAVRPFRVPKNTAPSIK